MTIGFASSAIGMKCFGGDEVKKNKKYMVMVTGQGQPNKVHESKAIAIEELERLLQQTKNVNCEGYVFEVKCKMKSFIGVKGVEV